MMEEPVKASEEMAGMGDGRCSRGSLWSWSYCGMSCIESTSRNCSGIGIYSMELVFIQKVMKALQNERAELLMVMYRRSHSPVQRRWKMRWKNKCWVINTHLTTFLLSMIKTFFFLLQYLFYPECLWASEIHSCTFERPWATLIFR